MSRRALRSAGPLSLAGAAVILLFGAGPAGRAQDADPPCRLDELQAAAFLVGTWNVTQRERLPAAAAGWRERTGRSVWTRRVGGCAFIEELTLDEADDAYHEMRVLAYDRRAAGWTIGVIDSSHGNLVTMAGRHVPGGLEFTSAQTGRGRLLLDRLVYRAAGADRVEVRTETSSDAGELWTTLVETRYVRKPAHVP